VNALNQQPRPLSILNTPSARLRGLSGVAVVGAPYRVAAAAAAGATAWLIARTAAACVPWDLEVSSVVPADAGPYPANAAIVVRGHRLLPDQLVATVDGMPAMLVVVPELSLADTVFTEQFRTLAVRVDPMPMPGQTVTVAGDPCDIDPPQTCPALDVEYVAGPPDDAPPILTGDVSFDLLRYTEVQWNDCGEWGSEIWVHPQVDGDPMAAEAVVQFRLAAVHPDVPGDQSGAHLDELGDPEILSTSTSVIGDAFPFDGWCVSLHLLDAAANASDPIETCLPCMGAVEETWSFEGPAWEPIPGGECAEDPGDTDGGSTGDESDTTNDGPTSSGSSTGDDSTGWSDSGQPGDGDAACACRGTTRAVPTWMLIATLALAGRRRRPACGG
jgi:hypothetical protein